MLWHEYILGYGDRLNIIDLESAELRRILTGLIILYKLLHKNIDCNVCNIFSFNSLLNIRGHAYKLVKNRCRLGCSKFSLSFGVIIVRNL